MLILRRVLSHGDVLLAQQTLREKSASAMANTAPRITSKTNSIKFLVKILFTRISDSIVSTNRSKRTIMSPGGGTTSKRCTRSASDSSLNNAH